MIEKKIGCSCGCPTMHSDYGECILYLKRELTDKKTKMKEWRRAFVDLKQIAYNMSIGRNFNSDLDMMIKILNDTVR